MRLHRNLVYTTIDDEMPYLTKENMPIKWLPDPKDKRWEVPDRKFVAETIYEVDGKDYT
jgi:hypothetical protein